MGAPLVTVVIPVLDEAARLSDCLAALAAQDLPASTIEVLVVDGGSTDGTVAEARRLLAGRGWWRAAVLSSPAGDRSSNLNVGLAAASAPMLVRVDARSRPPSHYLRRCLDVLEARPDVAVVGGRQRAVAPGGGTMAIGVARALNNRWGTGLSKYRRSTVSGPTETVYLGVYRTAQLRGIGGWRTDLAVNEDFDVNRRLRPLGTAWFEAGLTVDYVPRPLLGLLRQYWAFGIGKARYWRLSGDRPRPRQILLLAGPAAGLALGGAVLATAGAGAAGLLVASAAAAALAVEVVGTDGPRAEGPASHLVATAALAGACSAWWAGVVAGSRP